MPRKAKTKPAEDMTKNIDNAALEKATKNADKLNQHLAKIDATYGDSQPYDPIRLINETKFYLQNAANSMLEAGNRLILLKEHEPHGEFIEALEQIGIVPRAAQRMMQAAIKFSGPSARALAHLGKTKLLELMVEDDQELESLAEGGTLAGHTLDEIECMTTRELQAALRKERKKRAEEKEAHDKLMTSKNNKIDDLAKRNYKLESRTIPWPQRCTEINIEVTNKTSDVLELMDHLDTLRDVIQSEQFEQEDLEAAKEMMGVVYYDAIDQMVKRVAELQEACDIVFGDLKYKARPLLQIESPSE